MKMPRDFKTARFIFFLTTLAMIYASVCIAKDDSLFAFLSFVCAVAELSLMTYWRPRWLRRCMGLQGYDQLPAHCADVMLLPIGRWLVQTITNVGAELFTVLVRDIVALVLLPLCTSTTRVIQRIDQFLARTLLLQQFHALRGPPTYTCA